MQLKAHVSCSMRLQGAFAVFELHTARPLGTVSVLRVRMGPHFAHDVKVDLSSLHNVSSERVRGLALIYNASLCDVVMTYYRCLSPEKLTALVSRCRGLMS